MYWWGEKRWKQGSTKSIRSRKNTATSLEFWKTLVQVEGNQAGLHTLNILVSHPVTETSTNPYIKKEII